MTPKLEIFHQSFSRRCLFSFLPWQPEFLRHHFSKSWWLKYDDILKIHIQKLSQSDWFENRSHSDCCHETFINSRNAYITTRQAVKYSSRSVLSASHCTIHLSQINRIPVELYVCKNDLQFGAISNHSEWGTFSEPKYNLSYILFKTISIFRILNNCFIVHPKHTYRYDLVFTYEWRENASILVRK